MKDLKWKFELKIELKVLAVSTFVWFIFIYKHQSKHQFEEITNKKTTQAIDAQEVDHKNY